MKVYKGYHDSSVNTDNAWREAIVINFHDETGAHFNKDISNKKFIELNFLKLC
jgi:hypothetical protein